MLRPGSIPNRGSLPHDMLLLVHFHQDIHHNTLHVVVSMNKKEEKKEKGTI